MNKQSVWAIGAIVLVGALGVGMVLSRSSNANLDGGTTSPVSSQATSLAVDAGVRPPTAAAVASDAASAPCTEDSYAQHMRKGAELEASKKYVEALSEYADAHACKPSEARALVGRARVRMLPTFSMDELAGAHADLRKALSLTHDAAIAAEVWDTWADIEAARSKKHGVEMDAEALWLAQHAAPSEARAERAKAFKCPAPETYQPVGDDSGAMTEDGHPRVVELNGQAAIAEAIRKATVTQRVGGQSAGTPVLYDRQERMATVYNLAFSARKLLFSVELAGFPGLQMLRPSLTKSGEEIHGHAYFGEEGGERFTELDVFVHPTTERAWVYRRPKLGSLEDGDAPVPAYVVKRTPAGIHVSGFGCDQTFPWPSESPNDGGSRGQPEGDARAIEADAGSASKPRESRE